MVGKNVALPRSVLEAQRRRVKRRHSVHGVL